MIICIAKVFSSAQKPQQLLEQRNYTGIKVFDSCTFHGNCVLRFADNVRTSMFVPQISCSEAASLFSTYWLRLPLLKCSFVHVSQMFKIFTNYLTQIKSWWFQTYSNLEELH